MNACRDHQSYCPTPMRCSMERAIDAAIKRRVEARLAKACERGEHYTGCGHGTS